MQVTCSADMVVSPPTILPPVSPRASVANPSNRHTVAHLCQLPDNSDPATALPVLCARAQLETYNMVRLELELGSPDLMPPETRTLAGLGCPLPFLLWNLEDLAAHTLWPL